MLDIVNVLQMKFPDAMASGNIFLQDDGEGPYIKEWNVEGVPQPTDDDINEWANNADLEQKMVFKHNAVLNEPVLNELEAIDFKSIRALRENDQTRIASLTAEAAVLRARLLPTA